MFWRAFVLADPQRSTPPRNADKRVPLPGLGTTIFDFSYGIDETYRMASTK
jgi:hypothetical protein